jgi:hypothetical protein
VNEIKPDTKFEVFALDGVGIILDKPWMEIIVLKVVVPDDEDAIIVRPAHLTLLFAHFWLIMAQQHELVSYLIGKSQT